MKYIILLIVLSTIIIYIIEIYKEGFKKKDVSFEKIQSKTVIKDKTLKKKRRVLTNKKKKFVHLVLPSIVKVHDGMLKRYKRIAYDIKNKINNKEIEELKAKYKTQSDEELLARLKPHPVSIVLAQAAIESSWATSRFFKEANNVFGIWSVNPNEPRIAAGEKRDGNRTIWLKKFNTLEDSVRAYYDMISKGKAYNKLRILRVKYDDPYKITPGLDKYSEMGPAYEDIVNKLIKYNEFTKYDH